MSQIAIYSNVKIQLLGKNTTSLKVKNYSLLIGLLFNEYRPVLKSYSKPNI